MNHLTHTYRWDQITDHAQSNSDYVSYPNPTNKDQVEKAKHELDDAYNAEQQTFVREKILEIENAHLNHKARLAWDTVDEISGRKNTKKAKLEPKAQKKESSYGKAFRKPAW